MSADRSGDRLRSYASMAHEADWQRAGRRRPIGMPASMKSAGDIVPNAFAAMRQGETTIANATSSTGLQYDTAILSYTQRRRLAGYGPERLARDVETVRQTCERLRTFCESPIEHQMVPWLVCQHYGQFSAPAPVAHIPKEDQEPPDADLMIVPQFAFARFRLDFALVAKVGGNTKVVAVECDGAQFHGNALREFRRDRYLLGWNIETVHATGSEIARNPAHVAEEVSRHILDWAVTMGLDP